MVTCDDWVVRRSVPRRFLSLPFHVDFWRLVTLWLRSRAPFLHSIGLIRSEYPAEGTNDSIVAKVDYWITNRSIASNGINWFTLPLCLTVDRQLSLAVGGSSWFNCPLCFTSMRACNPVSGFVLLVAYHQNRQLLMVQVDLVDHSAVSRLSPANWVRISCWQFAVHRCSNSTSFE